MKNDISNRQQTKYEDSDYPVAVAFTDLSKSYKTGIQWHWHEEIEIVIINNGSAFISTDNSTTLVTAGQGMVINQNVLHQIAPFEGTDCAFYSVWFHPSFIFNDMGGILTSKYQKPMLGNKQINSILLDEENIRDERMLDSINDIIAVNLTRRNGFELATKAHLCNFWCTWLEYLDTNKKVEKFKNTVSQDEKRVKDAITFIEKNYSEQITLDDIAEYIHVSKSECCRCFKRTLKVSPFEYLIRYRIYVAMSTMLKNPNQRKSISQLSFAVGFNSTSYFNKMFRKYMSCTPTDYRKHLKNSPEEARSVFARSFLSTGGYDMKEIGDQDDDK